MGCSLCKGDCVCVFTRDDSWQRTLVRDPNQNLWRIACPTHPRYQVKRKPRSFCEHCWRMWIGQNP